ncbi:MAG: glutamine amidotransferase [Methyloligella sp. ZOD6]
MQKAIAIRHVLFEGLGSLEAVLQARQIELQYLDAGIDDLGPAANADLLLILGGSISAYQHDEFPFLKREIAVIKRAMDRGVPTFGICLGAQLMSLGLGAKVYANRECEIGWAPIALTEEGKESALAVLGANGGQVLHWHKDVFDLPEGTTRLASTELTPNQAFSKGRRILGVQFHPELQVNNLERWLIATSQALRGAGIRPQSLRDQARTHGPGMERTGKALLNAWLDQLD